MKIAQIIVTLALMQTLVRLVAAAIISIRLSAMEPVQLRLTPQGQIALIVGAIVIHALMRTLALCVLLATIFINLNAM